MRAYVTHIDQVALGREFVVYGARYRSEQAYRRSLTPSIGFTDPLWLADYLVPQFELALTEDEPARQTIYKGDARIRKIADVEGKDLQLALEE